MDLLVFVAPNHVKNKYWLLNYMVLTYPLKKLLVIGCLGGVVLTLFPVVIVAMNGVVRFISSGVFYRMGELHQLQALATNLAPALVVGGCFGAMMAWLRSTSVKQNWFVTMTLDIQKNLRIRLSLDDLVGTVLGLVGLWWLLYVRGYTGLFYLIGGFKNAVSILLPLNGWVITALWRECFLQVLWLTQFRHFREQLLATINNKLARVGLQPTEILLDLTEGILEVNVQGSEENLKSGYQALHEIPPIKLISRVCITLAEPVTLEGPSGSDQLVKQEPPAV